MRYRLSEVITYAKAHPGSWEQIVAVGKLDTVHDAIDIPESSLTTFRRFDLQPRPIPQSSPTASPWPWWARVIRKLASNSDSGIGDTIHRLILGKALAGVIRLTRYNCRCSSRRSRLNHQYRY